MSSFNLLSIYKLPYYFSDYMVRWFCIIIIFSIIHIIVVYSQHKLLHDRTEYIYQGTKVVHFIGNLIETSITFPKGCFEK